jgi:hypothetical protein
MPATVISPGQNFKLAYDLQSLIDSVGIDFIIFRSEIGYFGHTGKHPGADFLTVMKSKDYIRPIGPT